MSWSNLLSSPELFLEGHIEDKADYYHQGYHERWFLFFLKGIHFVK
jgi:hypothetical protein